MADPRNAFDLAELLELGVINLDKPVRWTSAHAVRVVQYLLAQAAGFEPKVGHAGTLDPAASGVLVLLVGRATRLAELLMNAGKEYVAEVRLGATSTTDDGEGKITDYLAPHRLVHEDQGCALGATDSLPASADTGGQAARGTHKTGPEGLLIAPSETAIREALARFAGAIEQRPPAHSAVHVNGKRAYKIARKGRVFETPLRTVTVHAMELLDYAWPTLRLRIECGRGTYIRSIARDIGVALGVGGYLAGLRRTRVGPFAASDAFPGDSLRVSNIADWLLPVERAAGAVPPQLHVRLDAKQAELMSLGLTLDALRIVDLTESGRPRLSPGPEGIEPLAAFDPAGRFLALCRLTGDNLRPIHVLRPTFG